MPVMREFLVLKGGQTDDRTERKRIWNESSIA